MTWIRGIDRRGGGALAFVFHVVFTSISANGQAPEPLFAPDGLHRIPLRSTTPISQRFKDIVTLAGKWDPRFDDFRPEQLAWSAQRGLDRLAVGLAAEGRAPREVLTEDGTAPELRPAALVGILKDPPLVVRWPTSDGSVIHAAQGRQAGPLLDRLAEFMAGFDQPGSRQIEFAIIGIEDIDPEHFAARTLVTAWGQTVSGVTQRNATWRIVWRQGGPPPASMPENPASAWDAFSDGLRIQSIDPLEYEEVTDGGPRYEDCTASVLGDSAELVRALGRGTEHWARALDRLAGFDLLGHTGLAVGDVNGDGLDDLFLAQPGGLPNALLIQQPDGTVRDTAREANVDFLDMTRAALLADADNDGDADLVMSVANATVIMENRGDGRFTPKPVLDARTVNIPSQFFSIAAADIDRDRFLDFYSVRYVRSEYGVDIPIPYFDAQNGPSNHLISHLGAWRFAERTREAALSENNNRFSLAAAWEDFDDDGDQDLYVANDFGRANFYVNEGGKFVDAAAARGAENLAAGMGVSWGDYDRDGRMDLYVTNMFSHAGQRVMSRPEFRASDTPEQRSKFQSHVMGNSLFRGRSDGTFEQLRGRMRSAVEGWAWGAMFVDVNQDGWLDLLVPNGNFSNGRLDDIDSLFFRRVAAESPLRYENAPRYADAWAAVSLMMLREFSWAGRQRNATFLNLRNGYFADMSAISGFGFRDDGRALALSDWDCDGDLDVWIKNRTAPALRLLRNRTISSDDPISGGAPRNSVALRLEGVQCNRDAVGARVTVQAGGRTYIESRRAGEGYLAQSSPWVHVGLGAVEKIDALTVRWPGGETEAFGGVELNGRYRLVQGAGQAQRVAQRETAGLKVAPGALPVEPRDLSAPAHVVLIDRLIMPELVLSQGEGKATALAEMLGQPYALVLWSTQRTESLAALRTLAAQQDALSAAGIKLLFVCVDPPDIAGAASAILHGISPGWLHHQAGPEFFDFLDAMQQEVLGRADDLIAPTVLTVDRRGLLASMQRGSCDVASIIGDANRDPSERAPFAGRVLYEVKRFYGKIADDLRARGHSELSNFYRTVSRTLQQGGR